MGTADPGSVGPPGPLPRLWGLQFSWAIAPEMDGNRVPHTLGSSPHSPPPLPPRTRMCRRPGASHTGEGARLSDARMSTHARLCSPSLTCIHPHGHMSAFPGCASALLSSILNLLGVAPHTPRPCPRLAASGPPCPVRGLPSEPAQWLRGGWDGAGTQLPFNVGHFRARVTRTPSAHPHWAPHKGQNHRYSETRWVLRCPSVLHFCGPARGHRGPSPAPTGLH